MSRYPIQVTRRLMWSWTPINEVFDVIYSLRSWRDSRPSARALFTANGREREPRSREGIGASRERRSRVARVFSRPALIPPLIPSAPATNPASYAGYVIYINVPLSILSESGDVTYSSHAILTSRYPVE